MVLGSELMEIARRHRWEELRPRDPVIPPFSRIINIQSNYSRFKKQKRRTTEVISKCSIGLKIKAG
jgi:hypothetical protein